MVATIKVLSSYTFNSVTSVSVGGKALSTSDYTVSGQIVTVPANKINGNVTINVSAEKVNTEPEEPGTGGGSGSGETQLVTLTNSSTNKYLSSAGVTNGDTTYRMSTFYIPFDGTVRVKTTHGITRTDKEFYTFVKWTDGTMSAIENVIIGTAPSTTFDNTYEVTEGLYSVSWTNGKYYGTDTPKVIDEGEFEVIYLDGVISTNEEEILLPNGMIASKYLKDGVIVSGSADYRIGKFYMETSGEVFISTNYAITRTDIPFTFLAKYTDDSYTTLDKIVIQTPPAKSYNGNLMLDSGYYAVCWNNSAGNSNIDSSECRVYKVTYNLQ